MDGLGASGVTQVGNVKRYRPPRVVGLVGQEWDVMKFPRSG